jgi:hypothetical protein
MRPHGNGRTGGLPRPAVPQTCSGHIYHESAGGAARLSGGNGRGATAVPGQCSALVRWSCSSPRAMLPSGARFRQAPRACREVIWSGSASRGVSGQDPAAWTAPVARILWRGSCGAVPVARIPCPEGRPVHRGRHHAGPAGGVRSADRRRTVVAPPGCRRHDSGALAKRGRSWGRGLAYRGQAGRRPGGGRVRAPSLPGARRVVAASRPAAPDDGPARGGPARGGPARGGPAHGGPARGGPARSGPCTTSPRSPARSAPSSGPASTAPVPWDADSSSGPGTRIAAQVKAGNERLAGACRRGTSAPGAPSRVRPWPWRWRPACRR